MKYYAIREKATLRFVAVTDFSHGDGSCRQIFASPYHPPLLLCAERLGPELKRRHIDLKRYEVIAVEIRKAEGGGL